MREQKQKWYIFHAGQCPALSSFKVGKLPKKVISVFGKLHVPVALHLHFGKMKTFSIIFGKKKHKTGENKAIFLHWEYLP